MTSLIRAALAVVATIALGAAPAADLMADGIDVFPAERSAAHILRLRKMNPE